MVAVGMILGIGRRHRRSRVGGVLGYKDPGGDLNDLKDFNKIKGAFAKPADAAPPPAASPAPARSLSPPDP